MSSHDLDEVDRAPLTSSAQLLTTLLDRMEHRSASAGQTSPLHRQRILTYLADLDALTQGLQRGSLVVLAGCTGMGKTSFVMNLARNISLHSQVPVLYAAYDSPPDALILRMLASLCDVESARIGAGRLSQDEWTQLGDALAKLSAAPLFWIQRPIGLQAIRQRCWSTVAGACMGRVQG